jgi:hypothetical protein
MRHVLTTSTEENGLAVIVRATTTDLEEPPDWQRRANYAIGEDRRAVLINAVCPRVKGWALQPTLRELLEQPETLGEGDVVVRRDWGHYGHLEVTIIEATGPLPARYLAVSRLPEGERDVYLDALIDDALSERGPIARLQIGEPVVSSTGAGEQVPIALPAPADIRRLQRTP